MLTFKRALMFAGIFLTTIYVLTRSHPSSNSRKPPNEQSLAKAEKDPHQSQTDPKALDPTLTSSSNAMRKLNPKWSQQILQDPSKATLRDKLAYQFPYDLETKFPAYIWQTWKYTPASGEFGDKFRPAEASWSDKHPGFIHEVITDQVAVHLLRHLYASVPEVLEAYNSLPIPVIKADFFRYLILLARGGIYSDIDTYALQSATEWLPQHVPRESVGLVIGIEADPDRPDWSEWYSRRIQFCQWTIQSKPGHPVLRNIVANITQQILQRKAAGTLKSVIVKDVMNLSGPGVWTDIIFDYMNDPTYFDMSTSGGAITWKNFTGMDTAKKVGDVAVLPITSFSPDVGQMGAKGLDDPMAFVKHDFEGTWKPESERFKDPK